MKLNTRLDLIVSTHLILTEKGFKFMLFYWQYWHISNLKEGRVIDGDPVEEAGVEAKNEAVVVEVSSQPPPQGQSVAEANMGQWWSPEVRGHREAGLGGPASHNEADAFIQMIQTTVDTFKNL